MIRAGQYADCYAANSDSGTNTIVPGKSISCNTGNVSQRLEVVDAGGATASFAGGYYLALRAAMNSAPNAALPNACTSTYGTPYSGFTTAICNQTQDNGFAMLLAKNVPGGESMVVKFNTSFGPLPGLGLTP